MPPDTEERLASFTELVATAIANAESRAGLARLAEEQAALRRVATLVAGGTPPGEVFAAVTAEVERLLPVDFAHLGRYEPDGTITVLATCGSTAEHFPRWPPVEPGREEPRRTIVFETGRPARIDGYADGSGPLGVTGRELGIRSIGRYADHRRGPCVGSDRSPALPLHAVAAGGHRGAPGLVHRAGGDGDRQRRESRRVDRFARADRRRR